MAEFDIEHAVHHLSELIDRALSGEEVVIAEGDRPLVQLTAMARRRKPREFGSARGLVEMADNFDAPLEDFREYV